MRTERLRRSILLLLAALLLTAAGCPVTKPIPIPTPPDERPDPVEHPGPQLDHDESPARWIPWPEPDVSHLLDMPEPPEPPEPPGPEAPERPAPVPQPDDPPAAIDGSYAAWAGADEPVIDWEACCAEPEGEPGEPGGQKPPDEDPPYVPPEPNSMLGLYARGHGVLPENDYQSLLIFWGGVASEETVAGYHWTMTGSGWTATSRGKAATNPTREKAIIFTELAPLGWYTFTVYARFTDGTEGPTATVRGQATAGRPPCTYPPGGCEEEDE